VTTSVTERWSGIDAPTDSDRRCRSFCTRLDRAGSLQRLSTHDVPANQRLSYLHDFVAAQIGGLRFAPKDNATFGFDLTTQTFDGDVVLGKTCYSAVTGSRDRQLLSDGRCNYVMSIHDTDYEMEMGGRHSTVRAGDIVIVDESQPFTFTLPGTRAAIMALNRKRIEQHAPEIAAGPVHYIAGTSPEAALLSGYVALLNQHALSYDTGAITDHLMHLVARLLGRPRVLEASGREAIGTARMALVKTDIERHLTDPALSLDAVALRQGISSRYIQQLFARRGLTFSDHVRNRRLDHAMKQLRGPANLDRTISDIAFETGFGDLSSFNRAFRKRFGASPRDIRAAALAAHLRD